MSDEENKQDFELYINQLIENKDLIPAEVRGLISSAQNLGIKLEWGNERRTRSSLPRNTQSETQKFCETYLIKTKVNETGVSDTKFNDILAQFPDLSIENDNLQVCSTSSGFFQSTPIKSKEPTSIFADLTVVSVEKIEKEFNNSRFNTSPVVVIDVINKSNSGESRKFIIEDSDIHEIHFSDSETTINTVSLNKKFLDLNLTDSDSNPSTPDKQIFQPNQFELDRQILAERIRLLLLHFEEYDLIIPSYFFKETDQIFIPKMPEEDNLLGEGNQNNDEHSVKMNPGIFNGDHDQDFNYFLVRFKRACKVNGWGTDEQKARYFPCYLSGPALICLENFEAENPDAAYDDMIEHFKTEFAAKMPVDRAEFKLRTRVQLPKESIESYFQDIMWLCRQVNSEMNEKDKVRHLLHGLSKRLIKNVMLLENDTPQDVLDNARKVEIAEAYSETIIDPQLSFINSSNSAIEKLTDQVAQLAKITMDSRSVHMQPQNQQNFNQNNGRHVRFDNNNQYRRFNNNFGRGGQYYNNIRRQEYENRGYFRGPPPFPRNPNYNGFNRQDTRPHFNQQNRGRGGRFDQHPQQYNRLQNNGNNGHRNGTSQANRGRSPMETNTRTADGRVRCFRCNRIGHYASSCENQQRNGGPQQHQNTPRNSQQGNVSGQ